MPQLVKGGKYVFGWSLVKSSGTIRVPEEARNEYRLKPNDRLYVLQASKTSKGFAITTRKLIKNSIFNETIRKIPNLFSFCLLENGYAVYENKTYTWTVMDCSGYLKIDPNILEKYSVSINDKLLVGRGSRYALAFIKQGTIVNEALKHDELTIYE
jgi:bifunctional DNA-binding transcriptional regulator/antitoxin component of YhaV-PrlF toxin-antitoxin module